MRVTIFRFMQGNMNEIKKIIKGLDKTFNAHEFIKEFENRFKQDYNDYLGSYSGNKPMKVNGQIARFLSKYESTLEISKTRRVSSLNANGRKSTVQEWKNIF